MRTQHRPNYHHEGNRFIICGIIALSRLPGASSIPNTQRFTNAGLLAIEDRGRHATGVGWTRGKRKVVWTHSLEGPASRVAAKLDIDTKARVHALIGHTRHATLGPSSVRANRHPVVANNIVLVHNGRVDNHTELIDLTGLDRIGEVDSWALPALLSQQHALGADHPTELLELVEGCASMAWLDSEDTSVLHLARLTQRPMAIAFTKRGDVVMASTRRALDKWSKLGRVGLHDYFDVDEGEYLAVRDGKIVDWRDFEPRQPATVYAEDVPTVSRETARGYAHGITDAFDQPGDWWDETERVFDMSRAEIEAPAVTYSEPMSYDEWVSR